MSTAAITSRLEPSTAYRCQSCGICLPIHVRQRGVCSVPYPRPSDYPGQCNGNYPEYPGARTTISRIAYEVVGKEFQSDEAAEFGVFGFVNDTMPPPPSFSTMR